VLKAFTRTINARLRKADVFARTGGEEFAIYLPFIHLPDAVQLCEQIREEVKKTVVRVGDRDIRITSSIGLAEHAVGDDVTQLMAKADAALYVEKISGSPRSRQAMPAGLSASRRSSSTHWMRLPPQSAA
jgi:diguanylate cyclase (GGDEF)-like protein